MILTCLATTFTPSVTYEQKYKNDYIYANIYLLNLGRESNELMKDFEFL